MPLRILLLVCLALLATGCDPLRRPPAGPESEPWRHRALLDEGRTLTIELDQVEGAELHPRAIRLLERRLSLYLEGGVEIQFDDTIPRAAWDEGPGGGAGVADIALEWADVPEDSRSYLYLLSAPRWERWRGYAWPAGRLSRDLRIPVLAMFTEPIKGILWITKARQQALTLIHEFGHSLGLVSNDCHRASGQHCANAWCVMYDGVDGRSIFANGLATLFTGYLPSHFCRLCRSDLYQGEDLPPGWVLTPTGQRRARPEATGCDPHWREP